MTIGKLVLSPTRTYMPLIKNILDECRDNLNGLIHCSGGGQTKVSKFIQNKVRIVKNNLLPVPPLFDLIKKESGATWEEMYKVFNMGHRLEAYTSSEKDAQKMIELAGKFNIDAQIIGKVEYSETPGVTIQTEDYTIAY
jgi:phosphoribosylformylglycinamidine cyclo-ligase